MTSNLAYGYWEVSIEKSVRVKLPTALLRALPEDERKAFYVTHGFGEHIMLWSEKAYQEQMEYLNSLDRNLVLVKRYRELGGTYLTISTDAHDTRFLGFGIDLLEDMARTAGFSELTVFQKHEPFTVSL